MQSFTTLTGIVAPIDRINVDTDQIIPAQYLKRIERSGYGPYLFDSWRYQADRTPNPDFILNNPAFKNASMLVAGRNFGSGSSREHAVWALSDYGFRVIVAPSLAEIFHKNCFENGLLPVLLSQTEVDHVMKQSKEGSNYELTVDLETCLISDHKGFEVPFIVHHDLPTHEFSRWCLLNGLDQIDLTLEHEADIGTFEKQRGKHGGVLDST